MKNFQKLPIQTTLNQTFNQLFPPGFMRTYTQFYNWDSMIKASGFNDRSDEDFVAIPDDKLDEFIRTKTQFSNWDSMLKVANQIKGLKK